MKRYFKLPGLTDIAATMGAAVGSFTKARNNILAKSPEFHQEMVETAIWDGGDFLRNKDAAQRRAIQNGWLFKSINEIAKNVSTGEMDIFWNPSGVESEGEVLPNHPFTKVLRRPNQYMGRGMLWQYTSWWLELDGNSFWFLQPDSGNGISQIWPLPANKIRIELAPDKKSIFRYTLMLNRWFYIDPKYICHFKYVNPYNFFRGMPKLVASMMEIDSDSAMKLWNGSFFGADNVMPSSVISLGSGNPDKPIDPEDVDAVRAELQSEYQAIKRKTIVTNAQQMSVALLGWNAKDMDFISGMQWNKDAIFEIMGLYPGKYASNATEANATVADNSFKSDTIWPIHQLCQEEITSQILEVFYTQGMEARFKDIRPVDKKFKLDEDKMLESIAFIDEIRERKGMPPLPDGTGNMLLADRGAMRQMEMMAASQPKEDEEAVEGEEVDNKPKLLPSPKEKEAPEDKMDNKPADKAIEPEKKSISFEEDWQLFIRKSINALKASKSAAVKFSSDFIPADVIEGLQNDLHGAEYKGDILLLFDHWKEVAEKSNVKRLDYKPTGDETELPTDYLSTGIRHKSDKSPEEIKSLYDYINEHKEIPGKITVRLTNNGNEIEVMDGSHRVEIARELHVMKCPVIWSDENNIDDLPLMNSKSYDRIINDLRQATKILLEENVE